METLNQKIERELKSHGVEPTPEIVAACRTTIVGYTMVAGELRDALEDLSNHVGRLRVAYENGETGQSYIAARELLNDIPTSQFEDFARRVVAKQDPDDAARAAGGTGRRGR